MGQLRLRAATLNLPTLKTLTSVEGKWSVVNPQWGKGTPFTNPFLPKHLSRTSSNFLGLVGTSVDVAFLHPCLCLALASCSFLLFGNGFMLKPVDIIQNSVRN